MHVIIYSKTDYRSLMVFLLSIDVTSGSEITPCIKIDKPLSGKVMK